MTQDKQIQKKERGQRRRGEELKAVIFEAAVEILEKDGYEAVTFQNVARKAKTTRSVLYRYWKDAFSLIYEASRYTLEKSPNWGGAVMNQVFNSGHLRTDLVNMLVYMRNNSYLFPKNFLSSMYFEQAQGRHLLEGTIADVTGNNLIIIERILARAQERGEARENIGQMAKLLPFQMSRYHLFVENEPLDEQKIVEFVDEVLMPLYAVSQADEMRKNETKSSGY